MARRKGLFGEELPATMFTAVLLAIFIVASITMYTQFFGKMGMVERERVASSTAEFIFQQDGGMISDSGRVLDAFGNMTRLKVTITDTETGAYSSAGSIENASSASVGSMPLMVYSASDARFHLGRVDVYAAE